MSTRIIIEKDGERYEVEDADIRGDLFNEHFDVDFKQSINRKTGEAIGGWIKVRTLPPLIRTDNSAVIARLEAENAKLIETLGYRVFAKRNSCNCEWTKRAILERRCACLEAENAKLREALKPISEVVILQPLGENGTPHVADIVHCVDAVKAAQAIMKGEKK